MQINDIYELLNRFEAGCMTEFQLEMEGVKLVCKKGQEDSQIHNTATVAPERKAPQKVAAEAFVTAVQKTVTETVTAQTEETKENYVEVRAQIAGTFYREPSPDSAPFVQTGQKVKKGDTLGLLEAMKMFSNVTSPVDGEVVEILAEDESMAEYQQVLMRLKETQNV